MPYITLTMTDEDVAEAVVEWMRKQGYQPTDDLRIKVMELASGIGLNVLGIVPDFEGTAAMERKA